jgi:hypothetical protein
MKKIFLALIILTSFSTFAQKPCEIDSEFTDSLGMYKSLKQKLIFERNFAGNSTRLYFSLSANNGVLSLDLELLQRSNDFIKANCLDQKSKLYLQLSNGKIVTLLHASHETCGTLIRSEDGANNRITTSSFLFTKENFEDLKTNKITFMRIQYSGETVDFPFKTSFVSDLDNKTYEPETYFIDSLKCFID